MDYLEKQKSIKLGPLGCWVTHAWVGLTVPVPTVVGNSIGPHTIGASIAQENVGFSWAGLQHFIAR